MNKIPVKYFGKDKNIEYFGTNEPVLMPSEYIEKEKETRGVWFSTVANIDFEQMKDNSFESINKLKEYFNKVIDTLKEYHMNTIVFQVRPVGDALYKSNMNPWSSVLTGHEGMDPGFDPFGYFMDLAVKNNISVHAWINPYRAGRIDIKENNMTKEEFINSLDDMNFAKKHPECTILTKQNKLLLDPANEMVREFVSDSIVEIASNYNIKAVHIDDYFYPYEYIDDEFEEEKMKKAGFTNISDFRRHNVDLMIELIHKKLSKLSRKVEFGISPFGIYRTNMKFCDDSCKNKNAFWKKGSNNSKICTTNYESLYADIYKWMKNKWIDYVTPQCYFDFDNTKVSEKDGKEVSVCNARYADLVKWWSWAAKKTKCKLYIGQGIYRCGTIANFMDPYEIKNQLTYNELYKNISGTIFFTFKDFLNEENEILKQNREHLKECWTKDVLDI